MPMHIARRRPPAGGLVATGPRGAGDGGGVGMGRGGIGCAGNKGWSAGRFSKGSVKGLSEPRVPAGKFVISTTSFTLRTRRITLFMVGGSLSKPPCVVEVLALRPVVAVDFDQITSASARCVPSKPSLA